MVPKRAQLFVYDNDEHCEEVRKFLEDAGVLLKIRDIKNDPFSYNELMDIVGYLHIDHFLNKMSDAYTKQKLDKAMPPREEMIQLILKDQSLLRVPIVKASRLITIGYDKKKISDMLQINNGEGTVEEPRNIGSRYRVPKSKVHNRKRPAVSN
ncbi:MAG: hypothetical protein DRP47_03770 [Candidatus Zixiibacteriota bacterium]|nr:MAG: hypothetical protein DRP47_03770 [candidate division Zixibacteria bacterium]